MARAGVGRFRRPARRLPPSGGPTILEPGRRRPPLAGRAGPGAPPRRAGRGGGARDRPHPPAPWLTGPRLAAARHPPAGAALVVAMTQAGFSGSGRYFALPLGVACVVAGAGLSALFRLRPTARFAAAAALVLAIPVQGDALMSRSGPSRPCTPASSAPAALRTGPPAANRAITRGMADTPIDHRDRARWPAADGAGRAGAAGRAARAAGPSRPACHPPRRANR